MMSSLISFVLVSLTPVQNPIEVMAMLQQSQAQLDALQKIVNETQLSQESLKEVLRLTQQISQGINEALEPLQASRSANLGMSSHSKPGEKLSPEQETQLFQKFQKDVTDANVGDLSDIQKLETKLSGAKAGQVPKLSAQAEIKSWESLVRVSLQLAQLTDELRKQRKSAEISPADAKAIARDAVRGVDLGKTSPAESPQVVIR